jgi:trimethylamine--corrinoid protein Co-methyltransferase
MYDRMQTFSKKELTRIHDASMDILKNTGVVFNEPGVLKLFKENSFNVEGKAVFFDEKRVLEALETAPSRFKITARNPEKSVFIGEDDWVFVPTYGPPFVYTRDGQQRSGTMQDYDNICKLVQTSEHINMNGFKHVQPSDVPASTAYLDMLFSNITLCDKPYMGSTDTIQAARDSIAMAGIIFGGKEKLQDMAVMVGLINSLSPLQFSGEMAGALVEYARYRQPIVIANMIMSGISGPIKLPGLLALMNAEILAGITLSQLAGSGTPVIYGTTSCPTNLRRGTACIGSPESYVISSAAIQLARFYNLPSRAGGSLTDSLVPDAQALAEGALSLSTAVRNGANFILHACGATATYIGNGLEKWLIDEELCGMIRWMLTPIEITEENIAVETIKSVGIGGNYLSHPTTFKYCRTEFYENNMYCKQTHSRWLDAGGKRLDEVASEMLLKRLASYERPPIDSEIETTLSEFVTRRKKLYVTFAQILGETSGK